MNYQFFLFLVFYSIIPLYGVHEPLTQWTPLLAEVYDTLITESYFPFHVDKAMTNALDAFAHSVDEHSSFLGPESYKSLLKTTSGGFYGIGVELGPKRDDEDFLMILNVKAGSPAQKAELRRYDKIISIDGTRVGSLSIEECITRLKTEKRYSPVTLEILRDKKGYVKVVVKRDLINDDNCWCFFLPDQEILYCALSLFTQQVPSHFSSLLEKGMQKKPRGILIDLRDNVGGVLQSAIDCCGLFLPRKTLVASTKGRSGNSLERFLTEAKPLVPKDMPVILLVNGSTASAAEIMAKALQIHSAQSSDKTVSPYMYIVGTKTYGKGSVQDVKPVGNNCALKFTSALYYLPDDSCIQSEGIIPDILIKQTYPASAELKSLQKLYSPQKKVKAKEKFDKVPTEKRDNQTELRIKALKKDAQFLCACNLILLLDTAKNTKPKEIATHEQALSWLKKNHVSSQSIKPLAIT